MTNYGHWAVHFAKDELLTLRPATVYGRRTTQYLTQ